jgi:ribosome-binding protein aMBF1 (putative translation factor)
MNHFERANEIERAARTVVAAWTTNRLAAAVRRLDLALQIEPEAPTDTLELIARAAEACGSQSALARAMGVAVGTVSRWAHGHNRPSPMAIHKLESLVK